MVCCVPGQRGQVPLGELEVVSHRKSDVPADEGGDIRDAEGCCRVDAGSQVSVDPVAFGGVDVQVVAAIGHRGDGQPVPVH